MTIRSWNSWDLKFANLLLRLCCYIMRYSGNIFRTTSAEFSRHRWLRSISNFLSTSYDFSNMLRRNMLDSFLKYLFTNTFICKLKISPKQSETSEILKILFKIENSFQPALPKLKKKGSRVLCPGRKICVYVSDSKQLKNQGYRHDDVF